jgi:hypothetical protein
MFDMEIFLKMYEQVTQEKDSSKREVLRERMRILLTASKERGRDHSCEVFIR